MKLLLYMCSILLCLFAVYFGYIVFSILIKKKPVIMHNRWALIIMILGVSPAIVMNLLKVDIKNIESYFHIFMPLMFIGLIIFYLFILRGYSFYGLKSDDISSVVFKGLKKLEIDYEEKLTKILLPKENTEILVATQEWTGTGTIKIKSKDKALIKKIMTEIKENIITEKFVLKKNMVWFYSFFVIIFVGMSIGILILTTKF